MAIGFVHRGDATALVGGGIDNSGIGAAWVFIRNGGSWIQQGSKLVASGTVGGASQGTHPLADCSGPALELRRAQFSADPVNYAIQDRLKMDWEVAQRDEQIEGALSALDAKERAKKAAKALKAENRNEAKRLLSDGASGTMKLCVHA